jgi:hypothetical protein
MSNGIIELWNILHVYRGTICSHSGFLHIMRLMRLITTIPEAAKSSQSEEADFVTYFIHLSEQHLEQALLNPGQHD